MNTLLSAAAALSFAALSSGALPLLAAPAAFAQDSVTRSVPVQYGDLDVDQDAGAKALMIRIKMAARQACGGMPDTRDLQAVDSYKACVTRATGDAVAAVRSPLLTAEANHSQMPVSVASR